MNNSILRGICQKCEDPIVLDTDNPYEKNWRPKYTSMFHIGNTGRECTIEPVWFLSAKQIQVLRNSKEFGDWIIKRSKTQDGFVLRNTYDALAEVLIDEPFLVAKILKEASA